MMLSASSTESDKLHLQPVSRFGVAELIAGSVECFNCKSELVLELLKSVSKLVRGRGQGECFE